MRTIWQDIRFAARMLLKNTSVTLIAVVTLALGIGANTSLFSVINAVLLKPLPYPEAERIVTLASTDTRRGVERSSVAAPEFAEWQKQNRVFDRIAAYHYASLTMTGAGEPERVVGNRVTADFMKVLGVAPVIGRDLLPEEDQPNGNNRVALISHGLWQRRFAADPQLLDQTITLNGETFTIVGIMPPGFKFPSSSTDVWLPANLNYVRQPGQVNGFLSVVARLKPDVSLVEAQTEMREIANRIGQEYDENKFRGVSIVPLYEVIVGAVRPSLIALFGAVCLVLLIACANIANLLLARATARQKEIAIRTALGASRFRLIRQMLTESMLLAMLGGSGGLLLAVWSVDLLAGVVSNTLPRARELAIDAQTLLFTLLVSLFTGLLFGLAPAIQASRTNLNSTLKEGGRSQSASLRRGRLRSLLVVAQIALSLVLLVSAGLFIKSFRQLRNVSTGFDPAGVATMHISLPRTGYAESRQKAVFFQQVLARVSSLPGVQAAGVVTNLPLGNSL
ncbi:MAG: ADOP family duplicated permease, partial [Acidobacteria bacterium]|nr:ADOP family duplicated permease [Acidobacteriota bacterium]